MTSGSCSDRRPWRARGPEVIEMETVELADHNAVGQLDDTERFVF